MKSALILEKDIAARESASQLLGGLGYIVAPVRTPDEALNVASAISFDVIVTCTATKANERRSLTGGLKRSAPEATIILIADSSEKYERGRRGRRGHYAGVSAVIKHPVTAEVIRRVVEFGIDGFSLLPQGISPVDERRRKSF